MPETRKLNVFLSYASQDEAKVRELYRRLSAEPWISTWFDKEALLPGMDWDLEIYKGLRAADLILIFLSKESVAKEGYVQKEFKRALSYAEEKPEGTIFVIPLRLDECEVPLRLRDLQWVDNFAADGYERLLKSLQLRAEGLRITASAPKSPVSAPVGDDLDLYRFIQIPASSEVPYPFWIGKYPVTNAQYARFLDAPDFAAEEHWKGWLKFNEDCIQIGRWKSEGWEWLQYISGAKQLEPSYWRDDTFGFSNSENPVVGVNWYEANAYCKWLFCHLQELAESRADPRLRLRLVRLPLETEWIAAAGGDQPDGRYPWDLTGKMTSDEKEITRCANVFESYIKHTTPVNAYLRGASPYGVMDMAGNVREWQVNYSVWEEFGEKNLMALRGGSWHFNQDLARISRRDLGAPNLRSNFIGFRVVAIPSA